MTDPLNQQPARRSVSWVEPITESWESMEDPRPQKSPVIDFQPIFRPRTPKRGRSSSRQRTFHGLDKREALPSHTKPSTTITLRRRSSSRPTSSTLQSTPNKKRKIYRREYEDDYEDGKEDVELEKKNKEEREAESELFGLVKKWIDPLLDLTMDSPHRIMEKMLELRMCIEKALKRDDLTEGDEKIVREAIEKVWALAEDDDMGISV